MTTFASRILVGLDDAWGITGGCATINDILLGKFSGNSIAAGMRYDNVPIPSGAIINSAVMTFISLFDQPESNVVELDIMMQQADDPPDWTVCDTWARAVAAIAAGATLTNWVLDGFEWDNLAPVDSPDFAAGIQQIIDRPGWASGQAMMCLFADDGDSLNSFTAESFERDPAGSPLLTIDYTTIPPDPRRVTIRGRDDSEITVRGRGDSNLSVQGRDDAAVIVRGRDDSGLTVRGRDDTKLSIRGRG